MMLDKAKEVLEIEAEKWDAKPQIFQVKGKDVEFFPIGAFAQAINRTAATLRKWEELGTLPKTPYFTPSPDRRGRRRMYSRDMVEGVIRIAKEEKVYWPHKGVRISQTNFTKRVEELFLTHRPRRSN